MHAVARPRSVIVGAGIIGAATAFFLAQRGHEVRILEASAPAAGASGASDGAVSVASKSPGPMMEAARAGVALYRELTQSGIFAGLFHPRTTILIAETDVEAEALQKHAGQLAVVGVRTTNLSTAAFVEMCPPAARNVRAAVAVHGEGHALGYAITQRLLQASGATLARNCPVRGIVTASSGRTVTAVETDHGRIEADTLVIAAGHGSGELIGMEPMLVPRKGQLIVTERAPALAEAMPGSLMSCKYLTSKASVASSSAMIGARRFGLVIDPLRTGQLLIGGTREDAARKGNDLAAIRHLLSEAVALIPAIADLRVLRTFSGIRTATTDGKPILGRMPDYDNFFVATGFEGDGICLGPVMGQSIAALATGNAPPISLDAFSPARFAPRRLSI